VPVQKGKRRRKSRRRGASVAMGDESGAAPVAQKPTRQTIMRRGMDLPWGVNAAIGAGLLLAGVYFFVSTRGSVGQRLVFLFLYVLLAGFFLAKAYRQRRAAQQA
jgi:hypothetical protein